MSKRKILLIFLVMLFGLMLAACGTTDTDGDGDTGGEVSGDTGDGEAGDGDAGDGEPAEFVCEDAIGCITVAPGDPVHIVAAVVISGAVEVYGRATNVAVEMAVEERGQIAGHDILVTKEDPQCNAEGGAAIAERIAADPTVVGVIGTICSGAMTAAMGTISAAGLTMISPANTSPALTDPDETWEPGYFRTAHNDNFQGSMGANFAFDNLGFTTAAVVHDGDPYTEGLATVFKNNFEALGGTITSFNAVNKGDTDMLPVLTTIGADSPEILYLTLFQPEADFLVAQTEGVPGLENTIFMGADASFTSGFGPSTGSQALGMYHTSPFSSGAAYDEFLAKYEARAGEKPPAPFGEHGYDATNILLDALEAVVVEDADGTLHFGLQAIRDAVEATSGFDGLTGTLDCGEKDGYFGDCATGEALAVFQLTEAQIESEDNFPPDPVFIP
jgi:branched-chain amino acid transport system substrate-binding protein